MEVFIELTESELDQVAAGKAKAVLNIKNFQASGPADATVTADQVVVTAATVGGLTPSNTATISGTFTASSA